MAERVLAVFVHGSADLYGSDRVLLEVVRDTARAGRWRPLVVLHEPGPLLDALQAAGVETRVGAVGKIERAMWGPAAPWALAGALRRAGRDLDAAVAGRAVGFVYSNTLAVLGGAFWARRRGHRHLWHVHEIVRRPLPVRRGLPWLAQRLADLVVCNSAATAAWLLGEAPALAGRTRVVPNGLGARPAVVPGAAAAWRDALGFGPDATLAVLVGRINRMKGQGLFVDALARLRDEGRLGTLHAALVGDTRAGQEALRERLLAQVRSLGLQDRVRLVPFVADVDRVWAAADLAVVPSLEPESFGLVAIEAMAHGLPVIAAAHGGLLDIVVDGETGLLVAPGDAAALADALHRLAIDPGLRRRLGAAGVERQRREFSLERQLAQVAAACAEVAAR